MEKLKEPPKEEGFEVTREGYHKVAAFHGVSPEEADQLWIDKFGRLPRTVEEIKQAGATP